MSEASICIVGAGVTGLSLLLLLENRGFPLETITILDPCFDGGDLVRKWTTTESNTPWSKSIETLQQCCPGLVLPAEYLAKDQAGRCPLADLGRFVLAAASTALKRVTRIHGSASSASYDSATNTWSVIYKSGVTVSELRSKKIVLAIGAEPKSTDLDVPSIPLENALDSNRLRHIVRAGEKAVVIGTMHSGTIVMENLYKNGLTVSALYNTAKPFYWDRDGDYDGVKGEAAVIADAITNGERPQIELIHVQDISKVVRACSKADWVVYSMGFACRKSIDLIVNGEKMALTYDGLTGRLDKCNAAWGFGVGFPNRAPDGIHWDVSVAAFLKHMETQIASITL